jgi:hypothetical protein
LQTHYHRADQHHSRAAADAGNGCTHRGDSPANATNHTTMTLAYSNIKRYIPILVLTCAFLFLAIPNTSAKAAVKDSQDTKEWRAGKVIKDPANINRYFDNGLCGEGTN